MMHLTIFIYIMGLSLGLSAFGISLASYKLYRFKYLLAYVYYIAFLNIADFTFLIFYYYSLNLKESYIAYQFKMYLIIDVFVVFFLMVAGTYAFIVLATGIVEKVLPKILKYFYFIAFAIFFFIYLITTKEFIISESINLFVLNHNATTLFMLSVTLIAIIQIFFNVKKLQNSHKRKAVNIFGFIYLFIYTIIFIVFFLPHTANNILNSILCLSLNIVPILYLKRYLQRSYWELLAEPGRAEEIQHLFAEHNISKREKEVIHLILKGYSNKEIAQTLFISLPTAKQHIYNIYQKMGVKSRMQLNNFIRENINI